ncbi:unnamed protein product [Pleuronectes platessa]|uniref:Uncharacterized protein n=1 Tax=Pleuronectes platessa TaxID=8262 RepID=A0A9N7TYB8_PLEPL|nr:unnamed protein product [Pleuronectes platessa]
MGKIQPEDVSPAPSTILRQPPKQRSRPARVTEHLAAGTSATSSSEQTTPLGKDEGRGKRPRHEVTASGPPDGYVCPAEVLRTVRDRKEEEEEEEAEGEKEKAG